MGPSKEPTRVIIIGAGLAGLSMANALQRAEIDHVVLEKHQSIVSDRGAAVVMWPHIARIMDQLGCLDDFLKTCCPIHTEYRRTPDGEILRQSGLTTHWEEWCVYAVGISETPANWKHVSHGDKSRIPYTGPGPTGICGDALQPSPR